MVSEQARGPGGSDDPQSGHGPSGGDDHGGRNIPIVLNAQQVTVHDDTLTFEDILKLLTDFDPTALYRVTYEKADASPSSGVLVAGQKVKVRKGTVIHATPTDKS